MPRIRIEGGESEGGFTESFVEVERSALEGFRRDAEGTGSEVLIGSARHTPKQAAIADGRFFCRSLKENAHPGIAASSASCFSGVDTAGNTASHSKKGSGAGKESLTLTNSIGSVICHEVAGSRSDILEKSLSLLLSLKHVDSTKNLPATTTSAVPAKPVVASQPLQKRFSREERNAALQLASREVRTGKSSHEGSRRGSMRKGEGSTSGSVTSSKGRQKKAAVINLATLMEVEDVGKGDRAAPGSGFGSGSTLDAFKISLGSDSGLEKFKCPYAEPGRLPGGSQTSGASLKHQQPLSLSGMVRAYGSNQSSGSGSVKGDKPRFIVQKGNKPHHVMASNAGQVRAAFGMQKGSREEERRRDQYEDTLGLVRERMPLSTKETSSRLMKHGFKFQ